MSLQVDSNSPLQLWAQLHLQVAMDEIFVATEDSLYSDPYGFITLKLARPSMEKVLLTSRHHKLPLAASMSDVEPPTGVPRYNLDTVSIFVDITTSQNSKQRSVTSEVDESQPEQSKDSSDSYWTESSHGRKTQTNLAETERSYASKLENPFTQDHFVELVDAVLRTAICPLKLRFRAGLRLMSDARSISLAKLAPAVWSPGYIQVTNERAHQHTFELTHAAQNIAERACLLPTIDRALARFASRKKESQGSKENMSHLLSSCDSEVCLNEGVKIGPVSLGSFDNSDSCSTLARLWKTLHKGVFDAEASRRLKPIQSVELSNVSTDEEGSAR